MRTVPPLTTAAARNGTALDRSGSMTQRRAAIGPGATRHRLACGVVDLDTGLAQHRHRHRDVRRRRHRLAGVHDRQPVGERRAGQQQTRDELRRRRRVDLDRPAAHRPVAAHRERQAVAVDVHAEPAQPVQQRGDRPRPGLLVAVEHDRLGGQRRHRRHETQHGARQAAVDAGARRRGDRAADRQLGAVAVDGDAQRRAARRSSGRCRGCAAHR